MRTRVCPVAGRIAQWTRPRWRTAERGVLPEPGGRLLRLPGERLNGRPAVAPALEAVR